MKTKVVQTIKKANLLNCEDKEAIKNGQVFTKAKTIQELVDILKDIPNLSLSRDKFSTFMNGILFTIKEV